MSERLVSTSWRSGRADAASQRAQLEALDAANDSGRVVLPPRLERLQVHGASPDHAWARLDCLFLLLVRGPIKATVIHKLGTQMHAAAQSSAPHLALMPIVEAGAPLLSAEVREGLGKLHRDLSQQLISVAQVVEGSGFAAGAARSAMAGCTLSSGRSYPIRMFGEVSAASAWLATRVSVLGPSLRMEHLEEAVEHLRALVDHRQGRPAIAA